MDPSIFIGVVHYSPLMERKQQLNHLESSFPELEWITEKDIPEIQNSMYQFVEEINLMKELDFAAGLRLNSFTQHYSRPISELIIKILKIASRFNKRAKSSIMGSLPQRKALPLHWYEVALMHIEAIERGIAANKDWILVLEDDAVIQANFASTLRDLARMPRHERVWINLNDGIGPNLFTNKSDIPMRFGGFYQIKPPMTRCTVAYLLNRNLAIEILDEFKLYGIVNWIPIDFALDAIIKKLKVNCFWQDPASVLQGSSNGRFKSNLQEYRLNNE